HLHRLDRDQRLALRDRIARGDHHARHGPRHRGLEARARGAAGTTATRGLALEHEVERAEPNEALRPGGRDLDDRNPEVARQLEPPVAERLDADLELGVVHTHPIAPAALRLELDRA